MDSFSPRLSERGAATDDSHAAGNGHLSPEHVAKYDQRIQNFPIKEVGVKGHPDCGFWRRTSVIVRYLDCQGGACLHSVATGLLLDLGTFRARLVVCPLRTCGIRP